MIDPSYYHLKAPDAPSRPPLTGRHETATAIVGGGLAGISTALFLAERGSPAVVLEARSVGAGASGRNGGMVSMGFAAPEREIEARAGQVAASALLQLSREALSLIKDRIARYAVDCDPVEGVVIASWFDEARALEAEVERLNARYGTKMVFWPRERLQAAYPSPHYWCGIFDPEGFHLDPLALVRGYAGAAEGLGVVIHEESPVLGLEREGARWCVRTALGSLRAEQVVLCQSAYPPAVLPAVARATLPVFTYVIVTEPLVGRHAGVIRAPYAVYDTRFATGYYRLLRCGRLLWGGRISVEEHPRDLAGLMRRDLAQVYPQLADVRVEHAWSGRMGFTRHRMPLIRELAPGLWVNTGFGGHGLNTAVLGGDLVAAALTEGDERYRLFEPFAPRWVGGPFGRLAAQAIYWGRGAGDGLRAGWQRWRGGGEERRRRA